MTPDRTMGVGVPAALLHAVSSDGGRLLARSTLCRGSALALALSAQLDRMSRAWMTLPGAVGCRALDLDDLHGAILAGVEGVGSVIVEDEFATPADPCRTPSAFIGSSVIRWAPANLSRAVALMRPGPLGVPLCIYVSSSPPEALRLAPYAPLDAEGVCRLAASVTAVAVPVDDSESLLVLADHDILRRRARPRPADTLPYRPEEPPAAGTS